MAPRGDNAGLDAVRAILAEATRQGAAADVAGAAPHTPSADYRFDAAEPTPTEAEPLSADELLAECRLEPETDIGNARRLLIRYGDRILSVARVAWHGYDGLRWKEDEDGSIVRPLAQKTAEMIVEEAYALDASDEEKAAITAGTSARGEIKTLGQKVAERLRLRRGGRHLCLFNEAFNPHGGVERTGTASGRLVRDLKPEAERP